MGLFAKNPNETAYVGGRKHWADVIKNSGPEKLMIWRQPEEDFNTNSTLIVMPGEQAVFVKGGTVEQVFENGTYRLSTENYPFISRMRNALRGGISTFHCMVYFVRTAHSEEILWGTSSPIQARDKVWGVRTSIRARGSYKVHIDNAVIFLEKLLGSQAVFETQEGLNRYFINEFQSKIKSVISMGVNNLNTELIGLDAKLDEFSGLLKPVVDDIFKNYGMKCSAFSVSAMDVDKEKYDMIDESQLEAIKKRNIAQGEAAAMQILGEGWEKQQAVNLMNSLAVNPDIGGIGTMGAGLGVGMMAGGVFGGLAGKVFSSGAGQPAQSKTDAKTEDPVEILGKLKRLLDAGLIEQNEYDTKKQEILGRM